MSEKKLAQKNCSVLADPKSQSRGTTSKVWDGVQKAEEDNRQKLYELKEEGVSAAFMTTNNIAMWCVCVWNIYLASVLIESEAGISFTNSVFGALYFCLLPQWANVVFYHRLLLKRKTAMGQLMACLMHQVLVLQFESAQRPRSQTGMSPWCGS